VDNLFAMPVLLTELRRVVPATDSIAVVSPDAGGVERARAFAKRLDAGLAIADKRREKPNVAEVLRIVGDVSDRTAVIVDDLIDTGDSLTETAKAVMEAGAKAVLAAVTHPVLSGQALKRIEESVVFKVIATDSIPLRPEMAQSERINIVTVSQLLGESIRRIHNEESVSSLFV
jgi:ribose-phosphate pyrophosphokinase